MAQTQLETNLVDLRNNLLKLMQRKNELEFHLKYLIQNNPTNPTVEYLKGRISEIKFCIGLFSKD